MIINSQRQRKDQINKPEDLWSYDWDKKEIEKKKHYVTEFTDKEAQEFEDKFPTPIPHKKQQK